MTKTKSKKVMNKPKTVIAAVALVVVLIAAQLATNIYLYRRDLHARDNTILNLITLAVDGLHKPAPVDAKTGDTYLPEAKLFIPASSDLQDIQYNYNEFENTRELSITSQQVVNRAKSKLWTGYGSTSENAKQSYQEMFEQVPYLQACARGVQMCAAPQSDKALTERFTVTSNGTTWYAYTEKTCADALEQLITQLKTMRAY